MNKLFVIFFVALSAPAILGYKIQLNNEFEKELNDISELLGEKFNNIEELKLYLAKGIEEIEDDSEMDSALKAQLESAYEILKEVNGPEDLEKLKEFRQELDKTVKMVEEVIVAAFEKLAPELAKLEDVIEKMMQEFLEAVVGENTIKALTMEIEKPRENI